MPVGLAGQGQPGRDVARMAATGAAVIGALVWVVGDVRAVAQQQARRAEASELLALGRLELEDRPMPLLLAGRDPVAAPSPSAVERTSSLGQRAQEGRG